MGSLTWTDISSCCRGEEADQRGLRKACTSAAFTNNCSSFTFKSCHERETLALEMLKLLVVAAYFESVGVCDLLLRLALSVIKDFMD